MINCMRTVDKSNNNSLLHCVQSTIHRASLSDASLLETYDVTPPLMIYGSMEANFICKVTNILLEIGNDCGATWAEKDGRIWDASQQG